MANKDIEQLTDQEKKIITTIRELDYGSVEVTIKAGRPVFIHKKEARKLE